MAATFAEAVGVGAGTVVRLRLSKALRKLRLAVIRLPGSALHARVSTVGKQSLGLGPGIESGVFPVPLRVWAEESCRKGVTSGSCYVKQCSGSPLPSPTSVRPTSASRQAARRPRKGKTCPGEGPSHRARALPARITMCAWASRASAGGRRRGPPPLLRGEIDSGGGTPPSPAKGAVCCLVT